MMKRKMIAILLVAALAAALGACGEQEETTLTGMVVSVDGTVISLMEMDTGDLDGNFSGGERPEMPEGMEGFGGFNPDAFDGTMPEGEWGNGEMPGMPEGMEPPEDMTMPEGMEPPEDMTMPEGMEPPEGMTMPEAGGMPDFGGNGGMRPGFGNFGEDMETKDVDISGAHISVEIDGGKASGSMDDIKAGTFVTVTLNSKGEATYVLVSSMTGFGGGRDMGRAG